jgi:hypothetical protein
VVTLFSLLNGDSMLDIFVQLHSPDFEGLVADLYLATFCCIFIYCAVTVFIIIIARSYETQAEIREEQQQGYSQAADAAAMRWQQAAAAAGGLAAASQTSDDGSSGGGGGGTGSVQFSTYSPSSVGRQTVLPRGSYNLGGITSRGLNLFGSIANSLAQEDAGHDYNDDALGSGVPPPGGHSLSLTGGGGDATAAARGSFLGGVPSSGSLEMEMEAMGDDDTHTAAATADSSVDGGGQWKRHCMQQARIVGGARAELLQVLARMDAQLTALDESAAPTADAIGVSAAGGARERGGLRGAPS